MTSINFDNWSPIPNCEIESLCRNKHVPAKVRVRLAIIRIIVGFDENRPHMSAAISYSVLEKKTGANLRTVKRIVRQLDGKDGMKIDRGHGRGHRNIYSVDFNGLERQE